MDDFAIAPITERIIEGSLGGIFTGRGVSGDEGEINEFGVSQRGLSREQGGEE